MNTITKRLAQMTALYAAKKLWGQVDQEAAREMMGQLYRSAPSEWESAAKRAAGEGFDTMRSQATRSMDDLLDQVGLLRRSQIIPTRRLSSVGMGVAGGVVLTVAGGYFLYRTEAGKTLRRRMEESFSGDDELETAEHNMAGETVIKDPSAMDEPSAQVIDDPIIPPN